VRPISRIDFTPAQTTVTGVRPNSVKSALTSKAKKSTSTTLTAAITNHKLLRVLNVLLHCLTHFFQPHNALLQSPLSQRLVCQPLLLQPSYQTLLSHQPNPMVEHVGLWWAWIMFASPLPPLWGLKEEWPSLLPLLPYLTKNSCYIPSWCLHGWLAHLRDIF
jgi:hypothetical protein